MIKRKVNQPTARLPNLTPNERGPKTMREEIFLAPWGVNFSSLPNLCHKFTPKRVVDYVKVGIDTDGDGKDDAVVEMVNVDVDGDGKIDESAMIIHTDQNESGHLDSTQVVVEQVQ
jgi:hypothetical protein